MDTYETKLEELREIVKQLIVIGREQDKQEYDIKSEIEGVIDEELMEF